MKTLQQRSIQDVFKSEREAWLDEARATARRLLVRRSYITITDVLAETPRPKYLHVNTTGSVFKHEDFKTCGFQKSQSRLANGRVIRQWTLSDDLQHVARMIERNVEYGDVA